MERTEDFVDAVTRHLFEIVQVQSYRWASPHALDTSYDLVYVMCMYVVCMYVYVWCVCCVCGVCMCCVHVHLCVFYSVYIFCRTCGVDSSDGLLCCLWSTAAGVIAMDGAGDWVVLG